MKKAASNQAVVLNEKDLVMEKGLPAREIGKRLTSLTRTHRRLESVLCFYLQEANRRELYLDYGHGSTVDGGLCTGAFGSR
jgi:hypothetical protein